MFGLEIPLSLLPIYVVMLLFLGKSVTDANPKATSPENVASVQSYHLTVEQVRNLSQIQNQYAKQIEQLNQKLGQDERELTGLMSGKASPEEISRKYNQLQNLKQQAAQVYFKKFLAMREVLTLAQRRQLGEDFSRIGQATAH